MFQSSDHAHQPLMSVVAGDGEHVWSYVRLTVNRPWFFLVYTLHMEEGDLGDQVLLSAPEQVVDVFRRNGDEITVNQLMLVSPNHLNRSEHWQMEPIVQIWRGKRGTRTTFMYRLADGREYLDESNPVGRRKLAEMTCLVNFDARDSDSAARRAKSRNASRPSERSEELFAVRIPH